MLSSLVLFFAGQLTFAKMSSRSICSFLVKSVTVSTSTSLLSCFFICSNIFSSSASTTIVIQDNASSCVSLTAREEILYPLALNNPATRASTPNLFSTNTDIVCFIQKIAFGDDFQRFSQWYGKVFYTFLYYKKCDGSIFCLFCLRDRNRKMTEENEK